MAVKGMFGLFKNSLRPFLWPNCGWFCGLNCKCLWHVQNTILWLVGLKIWIIKGLFGGVCFLWLV